MRRVFIAKAASPNPAQGSWNVGGDPSSNSLRSQTMPRRYWIGVVSREHVRLGVAGGFAQVGHGKGAPLKRMKPGDWLIYYSPRESHPDGAPVKAFTAIGEVTGSEIYQVE